MAHLIRPMGVFVTEDQGLAYHKILGVPLGEPVWREANALSDAPQHLLRALEHFFTIYEDLGDKKTAVKRLLDTEEALATIEQARAALTA